MTQQVLPATRPVSDIESSEFDMTEGGSREDLYFYKCSNIFLKKGERASYELLSAKLLYEHVYEVTLPQNTLNYSYYYSDRDKDAGTTNKVWHSIKLNNNTQMPWTTGTAMVVKYENGTNKPVSQDILKYSPVKSETYLKITISPDISVKDTDKEKNRMEKAKKRNSNYYDQLTIEGSIQIKNYKDKPVKLTINRDIYGELIKSDINWSFTKVLNDNYYYYNNINPLNNVKWELELNGGEEKEVIYSYTLYIYSN
ncbi:MAG: hypothetical protein HY738_02505 [Bacteroidia bacterium]|nr:hypothetical protein [Bacteroidia bacterium]